MDKEQAAGGFEPPNNGFANRRLRPLGYAANLKNLRLSYQQSAGFAIKFDEIEAAIVFCLPLSGRCIVPIANCSKRYEREVGRADKIS